jgi:hypothetical protein
VITRLPPNVICRIDAERGRGREGSGGERKRTVGMKMGERIPKHAAREGCVCKLKNRMQQLLEGVQCCFFLHFADAHRGEDSAGYGLTSNEVKII